MGKVKKSRTEYSAKNTTLSVVCRIFAIIMGYVLRMVFTRKLSSTYVGINGLFVDIIQVLSLSEMGVGTAITYALYKPIAQEDVEKQKSLMELFRKFYMGIALVVALIGGAIIPFLGVLIKDYGTLSHVVPIFLLYLANAVFSYLWIYKKMLMDAHQYIYIGVSYQTISWVIQDILQIFVLIFTGNFILYLLVQIGVTITCNLLISHKANKMYPFLKEKNVRPLAKEDKENIFTNIKAMMMHKVGEVVINNTDNLIISAFVGIVEVGKYSNYYLVIESISQVLNQVFQGIAASVGNLGVTEDGKRVRKIFETSLFLGQWMYGLVGICIYELITPFVVISFGSQYSFSQKIVFILIIRFYLLGVRRATQVFHDSLGLFYFDRYKSLAEAFVNVVLSLLLVKYLGLFGIFLGTVLSMILVSVWVEPYVLYHYHLHSSVWNYYKKMIPYTVIMGIAWWITDWACQMAMGGSAGGEPWNILLCCFPLSLLIPNVLFVLVYHRTEEFCLAVRKAGKLMKHFLK